MDPTDWHKPQLVQKWVQSRYSTLKPMSEQMKPLDSTDFLWVDSVEAYSAAMARMLSELDECPLLGVDLEYHAGLSNVERSGILSLIQVSTLHCDFIFDCFYLRDHLRADISPQSLREVFANPDVVKIMHGCDSDLRLLVADLSMVCANVFDTARVFHYIQRVPPLKQMTESGSLQINKHLNHFSLENLVKLVLGVNLDKFFQVADWRIRPLPKGMLNYARSDSHYLIPIYAWLISLLSMPS